jgi:general secretion pathway protein D
MKVDDVLLLLRRFDISLGLETRVYRVENTQAERLDRIIKAFLSTQDSQRLYVSSVDKDGNLLIVRATPEIHVRIEELKKQVDVPVEATQTPIRFYKLKNANALDVLYTILSLQEVSAGQSAILGGGVSQTVPAGSTPYPPVAPQTPGGTSELPRALMPNESRTQRPGQNVQNPFQPYRFPLSPDEDVSSPIDNLQQTRAERLSTVLTPQVGLGATASLPGGARAAADTMTNSIVVAAPIEAQEMYKNLIESLDVRRLQVMIDAKIIAVDTTDDFTLGVEISGGDRQGSKRLLGFTSFGLSEVDPLTGALRIVPMNGFNGTLVNPEVADVVVQALATHTRSRVLASPRILVNDNSTGQLKSVASIPFASVNTAVTVSSQSLGGNQQAGTIITVTPHISENDHLLLEFSLEFSTFSGDAIGTLPPARQIDQVESSVTVPDGQTVIVGGLRRISGTSSMQGLPYLEKIPVLRELSSVNQKGASSTSFFLFIRPIILRDDKFEDLKHISSKSARIAETSGDYPASRPILVE